MGSPLRRGGRGCCLANENAGRAVFAQPTMHNYGRTPGGGGPRSLQSEVSRGSCLTLPSIAHQGLPPPIAELIRAKNLPDFWVLARGLLTPPPPTT